MRNQKGFTLIEIVIAVMLTGMLLAAAVPLLSSGRRTVRRWQEYQNIQVTGDCVFSLIRDEMRAAGQISLGSEICPEPEFAASCSDAAEFRNWEFLEEELAELGLSCELEAEKVAEDWILVRVKLVQGNETAYEREEILQNLNLGLTDREIDGEYGGHASAIWYQKGQK